VLPDNRPAILVVDGNADLRKSMARVLTAHGFLALEAGGGEDGLDQFERHRNRIGLAVIEMVMPGMTGLDLAAELERRQPGFPILYISSLGESIAVESIARRSPDRVMLKPFTDASLRKRVQKLLLETPAQRPAMQTT
jgi:DNA-binding response OmpR family regulator